MSFLSVAPDAVASAAGHLGAVGSALSAANATAAGPTTGLAAMAADDVSAAVQSLFATFGQGYQSISAQVEEFHSQFVSSLNGGLASYLSTEMANAQQVLVGGGAHSTPAAVVEPPSPPDTNPATVTTLFSFGGVTINEVVSPIGTFIIGSGNIGPFPVAFSLGGQVPPPLTSLDPFGI
jgi:hypothetical protein